VRILVTGSTGFAGRWLVDELRASGHEPIGSPNRAVLDIADASAVQGLVDASKPDAIVHLAALSSRADAARDPARTYAVNVAGTHNVIRAATNGRGAIPLLVASSSEVYDRAAMSAGPLTEDSPLLTQGNAYALSKREAEAIAMAAQADDQPIVITRAFNHTGPGQRADFAVPAFARRVIEARDRGASTIVAGNVDVERDIGDVRDTVRAYRLLIEGLTSGSIPVGTFNIATGRSVSLREVIRRLALAAGVSIEIGVDPSLVRSDDPTRIVGDASVLRAATGWEPNWALDSTLAGVIATMIAEQP
jgi:GDP-4-dehydro-6-deoxy-D-mannose reductase